MIKNTVTKPEILEKHVGENVHKTPRVSIITPAYNVAGYIAETLDSVFAQTCKDFEIIVVNDGSPDTEKFEEVLLPYFDKIIYIRQKNGGAASARNSGIGNARGEFVAFLDGDDLWLPEKLSTQIKFLDSTDYRMVYCDAELFGDDYFKHGTFMEQTPSKGEVTTTSLISGECNVITSGTMVEKTALDKFGLFDLGVESFEDFVLWFRLAKNGVKIGYQKDILIKYRVRMSGLSGNIIHRAEREIKALNAIKNKNALSEEEEIIWQKHMKLCRAELSATKGKIHLAQKNYSKARENFREANNFHRNFKYSLLYFLLWVSPKLVLLLFKAARPTEFAFIAPNNSEN